MFRVEMTSRERIDGVADHDGPWANFPALDQAVCDIGIVARERFHDCRIVRAEDEEGFIGGVGEGAGEEKFSAIVGLPRVAQVIVPEGAATRQIIINYFVDQREISHGDSLADLSHAILYRKCRIDFEGYLLHICR